MKKTLIYLCSFFIFYIPQIFAEIIEVDNAKLAILVKNGTPLVDIRTEKEWYRTGIIKGSKTLTFFDENGHFDIKVWMKELKKIAGGNDPLIIICRSGRRSRIVANYLNLQVGYKKVFHATNGIISWKESNYKTIPPK